MVGFLIVIGVVVVGAVALMPYAWGLERRRLRSFRADAKAMGLRHDPGDWRHVESFRTQVGGRELVITWPTQLVSSGTRRSRGLNVISEVRYQLAGLPPSLVAYQEGLNSTLNRAFGAKDHRTMDSGFDEQVYLQGDPLILYAFADPVLRRRLQPLIEQGASVRDGQFSWVVPGPHRLAAHPSRIAAIQLWVEAFDRAVAEVPARWLSDVVEEKAMERGLRRLLTHCPNRPETRHACEAGQNSDDTTIRALAAIGLRDGPTLRAMILDPLAPKFAQLDALKGLLSEGLTDCLDADLEPFLLRCLDDGEVAHQSLAARALAFAGTVDAVPRLRALLGKDPPKDLGRAVELAVRQIQARLPGRESGQLSLSRVSASDGALSPTRDAGELGLVGTDLDPDRTG